MSNLVPFKSPALDEESEPPAPAPAPLLRDVSLPARERSRKSVLVVDDDPMLCADLERELRNRHYDVIAVRDGMMALASFGRRRPDLVITDANPSKMGDWELLRWIRRQDRALPVIVLGAAHDCKTVVTAMREGAQDYVKKPLDFDELEQAVERAFSESADAAPEPDDDDAIDKQRPALSTFGDLVGSSPPMQKLYRLASTIAPSKASLLITGETGTGKGRLAKAIHDASDRADKPFVAVQATAFVENLLESELFGHERGAFTGADHRRIGRFEQAQHGTLFLDEVGEMSLSVQVKLLRVLQEKVIERVGGNDTISVDVRVIAATSRDLRAEVEAGRFREDLYYRLNVVHLEMPPLRVRGNDILLLAKSFLERCASDNGKQLDGFTARAKSKLLAHSWAGNVRELENTVERSVVLCDGKEVDSCHLDLEPPHCRMPLQRLDDIEREAILSTLAAVNSTARAAEVLGISVRTIQYRLKQYGLTGKRRRVF